MIIAEEKSQYVKEKSFEVSADYKQEPRGSVRNKKKKEEEEEEERTINSHLKGTMSDNITSNYPFSSGSDNTNTTATPATAPQPWSFVEETPSQVFRIAAFSLIMLASLIGNTMVCKASCEIRSRKPLSYHLVTNLAVAEIINTLCLPFTFVYVYLDQWPFRGFLCTLIIPLQVSAMFVVTSTLAAIAVYRYLFIVVQPFTRNMSSRTKAVILVLLWVFPFIFCLPLFMYYEVFYDNGIHCASIFPGDILSPNFAAGKISKWYSIALFIFNFALPYLVMLVSYGAVALELKRHIRRRTRHESIELSFTVQTSIVENQPAMNHQENEEANVGQTQVQHVTAKEEPAKEEHGKGSRGIIELEHDLLRMMYVVILVFVVCYIPYQVHFLYRQFGGVTTKATPYIVFYCDLLSMLPSALHPLCYGTMSTFYAKSFSRLVLCRK